MGRASEQLVRAGGVAGLAKSLRLVADEELSKEMKAVTKAAAQKVVPYAQKAVPTGPTGNLKKTIKAEGTRRYARIKAGTAKKVPYARSVHTGRYFASIGKRTKGTPYIRRSIPQAFPEIIDEFLAGMDRIAKKFNKKHGSDRVVGRFK